MAGGLFLWIRPRRWCIRAPTKDVLRTPSREVHKSTSGSPRKHPRTRRSEQEEAGLSLSLVLDEKTDRRVILDDVTHGSRGGQGDGAKSGASGGVGGGGGGGDGSGGGSHVTSSSDFQHLASPADGAHGRSQDELLLTPRSHDANPMAGVGVAGNGAAGRINVDRGHPPEFSASNGGGSNSANRHHQDSSPRPLQHMRSNGDLDALRPCKTRRTDPFFDQDDNQTDQDRPSAQESLAASLPPNGNGGAEGGFVRERGGCRNTAVSPHDTPAQRERSGATKGGRGGGEEGDEAGKEGYFIDLAKPSSMDKAGGLGGGQDSPSSSPSGAGNGNGGAGSGILEAGGLGLTTHAMSTAVEQVKTSQRVNGMVNGMKIPGTGAMGGGDGPQREQAAAKFPSHLDQHQRRQSIFPQPPRDSGAFCWGAGAGHKRQGSAGGESIAAEQRTTAAEAPELLRRSPSVDNFFEIFFISTREQCQYYLTKPLQFLVGEESPARGAQLAATRTLKDMLVEHTGDVATFATQEMIDAGAVPKFVEFLQRDHDPTLQLESAWVLTKIASGTSDHMQVVIEAGAVPTFARLIISPNDDICKQAVIALGKIAKSSPVRRDLVLQQGAMGFLVQQLTKQLADRSKRSVLISATRTLSILCRGRRHPTLQHESLALPTLAQLLRSEDEEVLSHAFRTLRFLCSLRYYSRKWGDESNEESDEENDWVDIGEYNAFDVVRRVTLAVIEAGICHSLVELLDYTSPAVQVQALRALRDIASYGIKKAIIDCGALTRLRNLLSSSESDIRKSACEAITVLIRDEGEWSTQAVIKANILPPYIRAIPGAGLGFWQRYAEFAIEKAIEVGMQEQIKDWLEEESNRFIIMMNAFNLLTKISERGQKEAQVQTGETEGTLHSESNQMAAYMMRIGGGERIKQLQMSGGLDHFVKSKARELLQRYPGVLGLSNRGDVVTLQEQSGAEHLLSLSQNKVVQEFFSSFLVD